MLDGGYVRATWLEQFKSTPPREPYYETPLGILVRIENTLTVQESRASELLVYGTRYQSGEQDVCMTSKNVTNRIVLPKYHVDMTLHALLLSSDFLYTTIASNIEDSRLAVPLPESGVPAPLTSNKRDRLSQLFDEAADARKRPRLNTDGRERSMSRASSVMTSPMLPQDGFAVDSLSAPKQSIGDSLADSNELQPPRRVSSSTIVGARTSSPASLLTALEVRPPSRARTLERTNTLLSQSFTADTMLEQQITTRNKELINRAVLLGMKTYGLKSYKAGSKTRTSESQVPETIDTPMEEIGEESTQTMEADPKDVEYKSIYHQTRTGVVFAFRKNIGSTMLRQETIKKVVDSLLAVFCVEPS